MTDPVGRADLVIVWDPAVVSEEQYARLVALLGDLVRACGGLGVERVTISYRGHGIPRTADEELDRERGGCSAEWFCNANPKEYCPCRDQPEDPAPTNKGG